MTEQLIDRWRAPLLRLVLGCFVFVAGTGFYLFFLGRYLPGSRPVGQSHWILGLLTLFPYAIYQLNHYRRVTNFSTTTHFKLGVAAALSYLIITISGIPIILMPEVPGLVNLAHIMAGFAFLIFMASHLTLVWQITQERLKVRQNKQSLT